MFTKLGFKELRIHRDSLNHQVKLIKGTNDNAPSIPISELSRGEQIAFSAILWSWGAKIKQKTEILLLDEFDAHLNPKLVEEFINIIQTIFIKHGVTVIMTTHSPYYCIACI